MLRNSIRRRVIEADLQVPSGLQAGRFCDKVKAMKAFVTGGTGFIGSQLVRLLIQEGHSVRMLSRKAETAGASGQDGVEVVEGTLEDFSSFVGAIDGTEVFYHVGEIKNVSKSAARKNVELVKALVGHLHLKEVGRFVFVSSLTVAGVPASVPATEETPPEIILEDHYTAYKRDCESLIREKSGDNAYVILRPAPVYGPGSRYLGRLIKTIKKIGPVGLPFAGDARNLAPLVYVKDLARAIYLAGVEPRAAGQTLNITDGERHSWFDFFQAIAGSSGSKLRILRMSPLLLRMPLLFFDPFSTFLGFDLDAARYVTYFSRDIFFDNGKAKAVLGWQPEYDLTRGVKEMVHDAKT